MSLSGTSGRLDEEEDTFLKRREGIHTHYLVYKVLTKKRNGWDSISLEWEPGTKSAYASAGGHPG